MINKFLCSLFSANFVLAQEICVLNGEEVPCEEVKETMGWLLGAGFILIIAVWLFVILSTIFWLAMIIHASKNPIQNKSTWITLILLLGVIGAVIYYFKVKRKFNESKENPL